MATVEVIVARFVERFNVTPRAWQDHRPEVEKDWVFRFRYANSRTQMGTFHVHSTWEQAERKAIEIAGRYMAPMVVDVLG